MKFIKGLAIVWHGLLPSFNIFTINIIFKNIKETTQDLTEKVYSQPTVKMR